MATHGTDFMLQIEGPDAERVAEELARFIENETGERPGPAMPRSAPERPLTRSVEIDPVALATLVLAIPPSLLAAVDLARRLELSERVNRFLGLSRELKESAPETKIELINPDGSALRLDTASADAVIEISMEKAQISVRPASAEGKR